MIGSFLGNYRIIEKIGDGGMGTVFLAEQEEIGRRAAVKVLHPHFFHDAEIRERFFKEARAISQLTHPGIVELYDYGSDEQGLAFIVMEYLQGEDLSKRLRRVGGLPVSYALHIARQVADGLGAAHHAGIIHRDLKPDNLFLVRAVGVDRVERVKILDFGVAKLLGDEQRNLRQTQTGTVIGTPPYMSPEQCRGNVPVDHRADLYALGCIMFRMMCGRTPFLSNGYGEMLAAHIHTPPPRPRDIEPSIPPMFEAIILKLLAKNPAQRFQSAQELMASIDEGVATTHLGPPEPISGSHPVNPGSGSRRRSSAAQQAEGDWVVEMQPSAGMGSGLTPAVSPVPGRVPLPTPGVMPVGTLGAMPVGTPAGIVLPSQLPTQALSGSQPIMASPWPATMSGDHPITTLQSAVIELPRTPVPMGPRKRRLGLVALGALVCLTSTMVTLFALEVGPFSSGQKLAVAEASGFMPDNRSTVTTSIAMTSRTDDSERPLPGTTEPDTTESDTTESDTTESDTTKADTTPSSPADDSKQPTIDVTTPREITLTIESDPDGAEIYRRADGVRIGRTPQEIVVPAIDGELVVMLKKDGYRDKEVVIPSDRSSTTSVDLERAASEAQKDRSPKRRPTRKPTPKSDDKNGDDKRKPPSSPGHDDSPNPFK